MYTFGISLLSSLLLIVAYLLITGRSLNDFRIVIFGFVSITSLVSVSVVSLSLYKTLPTTYNKGDLFLTEQIVVKDSVVYYETDTLEKNGKFSINYSRIKKPSKTSVSKDFSHKTPIVFIKDTSSLRILLKLEDQAKMVEFSKSMKFQFDTIKTIQYQMIKLEYEGNKWITAWSIPMIQKFPIVIFPESYKDTLSSYDLNPYKTL